MEDALLQAIPQVGVGVAAVIAIVYIVRSHSAERQDNQKAFMEFVNTNNHKTTELVLASTEAIKESTIAIKNSAEVNRETAGILKEVRDEMISERKHR